MISEDTKLFQKLHCINLNLQSSLYVENSFSLAVCPKSRYIAVGTLNRSQGSSICRLLLYKIENSDLISFFTQLNFQDSYFAAQPESYFYDLKMDTYLGDYPLILGIQQDTDHKLLSYILVDDKKYMEELLSKEMVSQSSLTPQKDIKKKFVANLIAPCFIPLVEPFNYHNHDVFKIIYDKKNEVYWSIDNSGILNKLQLDLF